MRLGPTWRCLENHPVFFNGRYIDSIHGWEFSTPCFEILHQEFHGISLGWIPKPTSHRATLCLPRNFGDFAVEEVELRQAMGAKHRGEIGSFKAKNHGDTKSYDLIWQFLSVKGYFVCFLKDCRVWHFHDVRLVSLNITGEIAYISLHLSRWTLSRVKRNPGNRHLRYLKPVVSSSSFSGDHRISESKKDVIRLASKTFQKKRRKELARRPAPL